MIFFFFDRYFPDSFFLPEKINVRFTQINKCWSFNRVADTGRVGGTGSHHFQGQKLFSTLTWNTEIFTYE